jgi:flagellar biosynthetic protein FliO
MTKYLTQFAKQKRTLVVLSCLLGGVVLLSFFPQGGGSAGGTGAVAAGETEAVAAGAGIPAAGPSMTALSVKLIGSVALIVGLLYAAMYAIRRFGPGLKLGGVNENAISVVHKRHIAPKKAIYILKIGGRSMVVGVTDSQICHLADLSQEELESIETKEAPRGTTFKQYLFGVEPGPKGRD